MRLRKGLPSLRSERPYAFVRHALLRASTDVFRVVHYSVQHDHVHLLLEADDGSALARGMQGLAVRVARAINRAFGRRGSVWRDRYHRRDLRTSREVRRALIYVLMNHRKHQSAPPDALDDCSSALWFDGWSLRAAPLLAELLATEGDRGRGALLPVPVRPPRTWLLGTGWRRHGEIEPEERPA